MIPHVIHFNEVYVMKKILIMIAALLTFFSCSEDTDSPVYVEHINLSADTLKVGPDGGVVDVTVESSGDWRLAGFSEWVNPSALSGKNGDKLSFTVQAGGEEEREIAYKVFTGSAVQKLLIMQELDYTLSLDSEEDIAVAASGGIVPISLSSNIPDLQVELSDNTNDWIVVKDISDAFGKKMVTVEVKENTTYISRTAELTIFGKGKSVKVRISQAQLDGILFDQTSYDIKGLEEQDFNIPLRTNLQWEIRDLPDWISVKEVIPGETVDGLQEQTLVLHISEGKASRKTSLRFYNTETDLIVETIDIAQKNSNPVFAVIPDLSFASALDAAGWVMPTEEEHKYEVLEPGIVSTALSLPDSDINSIVGIEAFPQIEELDIRGNNLSAIDISKLKNVKVLELKGCEKLETVNTGSNPVSNLDFGTYYFTITAMTLSGDNIQTMSFATNWPYGDKLKTLDVTGCPNLQTLDITERLMSVIYMTAAQKDKVEVIGGNAEVVVK